MALSRFCATPQVHQSALIQPHGYLHLQEGPIDLVIGVEGSEASIAEAYRVMNRAFSGVLSGLVAELSVLREPLIWQFQHGQFDSPVNGVIANRMWQCCYQVHTISEQNLQLQSLAQPLTAMAGVAGAVADHILTAGRTVAGVSKVWVNNGGDIALHLHGSSCFDCGIAGLENLQAELFSGLDFGCRNLGSVKFGNPSPVDRICDLQTDTNANKNGARKIRIKATDAIGGIATSGRHGRSLSMGIADAVTVLAEDAVRADIAATLIANAVDLPEHGAIERVPATELDPDSDLGCNQVVVDVRAISTPDCQRALAAGVAIADTLIKKGFIKAALLALGGQLQVAGHCPCDTLQAC